MLRSRRYTRISHPSISTLHSAACQKSTCITKSTLIKSQLASRNFIESQPASRSQHLSKVNLHHAIPSKVNLHHAINFRALCTANLVTCDSKTQPQRNLRSPSGFSQALTWGANRLLLITKIGTTSRWIQASASSNQGPVAGDLMPL